MTYCIRSLKIIITVIMKIYYPALALTTVIARHGSSFTLPPKFFSWVWVWSLQWDYNSWEQIITLFFFWFVPQCLAQYSGSLINDYKCMHVGLLGFTLRFSSIFLALKDSLHLFIRNFRRLLSVLSYFFSSFQKIKLILY